MNHLKITYQKHKIDSLLLASRWMKNYMKMCSFLYAHFFELMKVVENLLKKLLVKNSFIDKTYNYYANLPKYVIMSSTKHIGDTLFSL